MSHPTRVPAEVERRYRQVVELTLLGKTIPETSREVGLSRTSVIRIRRKAGLSRPKRDPLTPEQAIRAEEMLDDGAPIAEVVRTLGCGRSQIDARFPGRAWDIDQVIDHLRVLRTLASNHSAAQIDVFWASKKRATR